MDTTEAHAFTAVQRAYESGRGWWALRVALPVAVLPLVSWGLSGGSNSQALLGAGLLAVVALSLWRGDALGRGVPLGLKAGLIPLVLAHAARMYGHICTGSGCTSLCLPACILGGVAAGLWVTVGVRKSPAPRVTLLGATAVAITTGALGCACVGYSGIVGLILGMGGSVVAGQLITARRSGS